MEPIGFPGRFMIASFESDEPFYLDPWAGGKILEIKQVESLIGSYDLEKLRFGVIANNHSRYPC